MQPSIFTRVYIQSYGREFYREAEEIISKLHEIGFNVLDFNFFWGISDNPNFILKGDDWQAKVEKAAQIAADLGVTFSQAHAPFIRGCDKKCDAAFKTPGYQEYFEECTRRAYLACKILGVKYITAHPITCSHLNFERKASREANHAFYDKYVELGIKNGVGTAFENMLPCPDVTVLPARYCQHYDELIELVDSYNDPMVGICWDTGHANGMLYDQARSLRTVGKRLRSLHINDNIPCSRDEHLLPFMGSIDWYSVMGALAEIGYQGDMTLETHVGQDAFGKLQESMLKVSLDAAKTLIDIYNEAARKL